jgi:phosphoglycolate phosphatase
LRRPKAVIFDWDNTLIDSWASIHDAQNHTFEWFGLPPWTIEETKLRVRGSMRDTFPQIFGDRWQEAGEVFYKRFQERHLETLTPLPGAEDLLKQLFSGNYYLGVVSNKKGDYLRSEALSLGWDRYFGRIVGAFDAVRDKPWPDPIILALSESPIQPGREVWFVGDADVDMECAVNAQCVPVLIREEEPQKEECVGCIPALHVKDCMMLSKVFRKM